jgi:hypothetical protein
MGVLDDYLNSLEGKSELDPLAIAREMLELHNTELGTVNEQLSSATAKINSQASELAAKDTAIAEVQAEVTRVKTANYDLLMSTGVNSDNANPDERVVDGSTITPDDLFVKE